MEPVNQGTPAAPLLDQKLVHEIERLRLENEQLKKPPWLTPTVLVAVGGLIISGLANIQQYVSASQSDAQASAAQALGEQRWSIEREKLEAEITELRRKTAISSEDRRRIQAELQNLNPEIAIWDTAILKDTAQLQLDEAELAQFVAEKRPEQAEAQRNTVEMMKRAIETKNRERGVLVARRTELERSLGCD